MKKRTFLKLTTMGAVGSALPFGSCSQQVPITNWAGNLTYGTTNISSPTSTSEAQEIIKASKKIRPLGSQHSFSDIADSSIHLLSSKNLSFIGEIKKDPGTITVGAGARYGEFCDTIYQGGFMLENLASLPHISVGGACATSTHGSGVKNGGLATTARALELVRGDGEAVRLTRDDADFWGAVVGLGAIGFVASVELELHEDQPLQQIIYRNLPSAALDRDLLEIMSLGYSVSLFTDWMNGSVNQVWVKGTESEIAALPDTLHGAHRASRKMHPIDDHSAESCTEQLGEPGPWYERLPHFKMEFTPSSGEELQAEYFVPLEEGAKAMAVIEEMRDIIFPHLFISEVRTIAADDFWMSPFYKKPCLAIHFTWKPHGPEVMALLPKIEAALDPFGVRPHWGKLTTLNPKILQSRIAKLRDFKALAQEYDPEAKFRNSYLDHFVFS